MKWTVLSGHFWHDVWTFFFVVIIVVGVFMSQGLVIAFGVMGLSAGLISLVWNRLSLEDVYYTRELPQRRVFIGEEIPMRVALTNKKPVPLAWIHVEDEVPSALQVIEGDIDVNVHPNIQTIRHSSSMSWYERIYWDYRLKCTRRGLYRLGPAHLESGDPFGFLQSRRVDAPVDSLIIYPRVLPLEELDMPAARPLGDVRGGIRIIQDQSRPSGIRDYERGDPLKIVDWKATAKMQGLQVRTFEPSTSTTVIVVVAVDTSEPYWASYDADALERVITAAASVASYAVEQQYVVGLFTNDMPIMEGRPFVVPPSRGRDHISVVLGALATVRLYALGAMSGLLAQHSRRFPAGATLVVATAYLSPEFVDTLHDLKRRGYKIVVLYVGEAPRPDLAEGILVYELLALLVDLQKESELVSV
jgi:uncharacterized protein (DUF58 family)